jgi:DNA invertase Pin-like site-specific DNA recombinase
MQSVAELSKPGRLDARANGSATGLVTAVIYTRVSTEDQAREGVSLDAQLSECRRYAARPGWVLGDEYQDVLSGKRDDRPQYQSLLAEVRRLRAEGRQVAVVVAALDRFGRKLLERVRCREELKALGVPTHSVREGGEVSDIVANVLAAVAQEEVRRLGERVSASRVHIGLTGWRTSSKCPWGYRWRPATDDERRAGSPLRVLEFDPITAPYARELFERVARGQTVRAAARWACALPEIVRGGRAFYYPCVRSILGSSLYVARVAHGEGDILDHPRGHWPPLIDDATWRLVQQQIGSHRRMPRQASGRYLLTGLARCPECGYRMAARKYARRRFRYRCLSGTSGATAPSRTCLWSVTGAPFEADVLDQVSGLVRAAADVEPSVQAALRRSWLGLRQPASDSVAQRSKALEREAARARERLTGAATLLVDGTLDKAGYELLRDKHCAELDAAEAELARLQAAAPAPTLPPLSEVLSQAGSWTRILREASVGAQRPVLGVLIERVTPHRTGRGRYQASISWTPLGLALKRAVGELSAAEVA